MWERSPPEVPPFDAVKREALSSADGPPGLLTGCQIGGNMLSGLRLS